MYERIKILREENDFTQKQIADILDCSQTGYGKYELGKRDIPSFMLIKLAKHYQTSIDYLLNMTDEIKPYPTAKKIKE